MASIHLPEEIITMICFRIRGVIKGRGTDQEWRQDRSNVIDLIKVARINNAWHHASLPVLFQTIHIDEMSQNNTVYDVLGRLLLNPNKAHLVRHVRIASSQEHQPETLGPSPTF